jgi:hypothetical protein
MRRTPCLRIVLGIIGLGWVCGLSGCTHNYYYGTSPTMQGCPPVVGQTVTTQVGSVCDVPSGNVMVSGGSSSRAMNSNVEPRPASSAGSLAMGPSDRVVISQPAYGPPSVGQVSNRMRSPWKRPDPEPVPILKAEGAYDDTTIR